jgi:hypothetical protein
MGQMFPQTEDGTRCLKAPSPYSSNARFFSDLVRDQFGRFSDIRLEVTPGHDVFDRECVRIFGSGCYC